jgi:hypothetical protein
MTIRHQTVKGRELRKGDLMRLGFSTNYVLVADATTISGLTRVTVYNGDVPAPNWTLSFDPEEPLSLAARGLGPNDRIEP